MADGQASRNPSPEHIPMLEHLPSPNPQPLVPPPAPGSRAEGEEWKMFDEFTNIGYKPQQPEALNVPITIPDSSEAIPIVESLSTGKGKGKASESEKAMGTVAGADTQAVVDKLEKEAEKNAVGKGKRPQDHDNEEAEVEAEEYRERLAEKMSGRRF